MECLDDLKYDAISKQCLYDYHVKDCGGNSTTLQPATTVTFTVASDLTTSEPATEETSEVATVTSETAAAAEASTDTTEKSEPCRHHKSGFIATGCSSRFTVCIDG
ncbi:unnamed protein product [Toxocara canis]|uniref:Chitin-binding type-2 domain-containing protein n=1 Tax=Toxocara canis TaxID=6265 RepID=A0A3P7HBX8_TOXCA|nr:unnamed protein product [Toxocara canis]